MSNLRYAVSLEICHIMTYSEAQALESEIKHRLADINQDIYVCVGTYEQVRQREIDAVDLSI